MKLVSAFILLIAFIAQTGSRFVVQLDYELNKAYIAKNLCENRDKPRLCCRGKCYLKKQLAKSEKDENSPTGKTGKSRNDQLFIAIPKRSIHFLIADNIQNNYPVTGNDHLPDGRFNSVFHPPQL